MQAQQRALDRRTGAAVRARAPAPRPRALGLARTRNSPPILVARAAAAEQFGAQVCVVLGTQWGDEGKGKLVDILAQQYDVVCRAQVRFLFGLFSRRDDDVGAPPRSGASRRRRPICSPEFWPSSPPYAVV